MDTQTPDTGASTASPPVTGTPDFAAFERDSLDRALGKSTRTDAPADSSPAPSGEQSASNPDATEQTAASEPAKPADKPKRNLDTRHAEVDEKIAELKQKLAIKRELESQLAQRDQQTKPAESSPASPTKDEWQRYRQHPDAPKVDQFESYEDWVAAFGVFVADQRFADRERVQQARTRQQERQTEIDQITSAFNDKLTAYEQAEPKFLDKVHPRLLEIPTVWSCLQNGIQPTPANALIEEITKSDIPGPLLVHFSTPEGQKEWQELAALGAKDATAMLRRFGRIEARFEKRDESAAPKKEPVKTVTSAPDPPTVLGRKPAEASDPIHAAIKTGDVGAFEREFISRELARRRP